MPQTGESKIVDDVTFHFVYGNFELLLHSAHCVADKRREKEGKERETEGKVWSGMVRYCHGWADTSGSHQPTSSANEVARRADQSAPADPPKMEGTKDKMELKRPTKILPSFALASSLPHNLILIFI